jgi:TolB protein
MKIKIILASLTALATSAIFMHAQQGNGVLTGKVTEGKKYKMAVIDFRGVGDAQKLMATFNSTLWDELKNSGALEMVGKTFYPIEVPQQPQDFKPPTEAPGLRRGDPSRTVKNGPWLTDWSKPPTSADYLTFGYTAVQDGRLLLRGFLFNVGQPDVNSADLIHKLYFGSLDDAGAKKVAREFAADILQQFGQKSLAGTKIFFVSDRTGNKEIWSMDYDGSNQKPMTSYKTISKDPTVSADGKMFAFHTLTKSGWQIMVHSVETGKKLPFYNMSTSTIETPEFAPDGKHVLFAATVEGWLQICMTDLTGGNLTRLSHVRALEVSPTVNPQTKTDVLFISGRSGIEQMWHMNINGGELDMVTNGEGYVANPAWHPRGQLIAFAWTKGFEPGSYNIFLMDFATHTVKAQLTSNAGKNEHPYWAPDGIHLVYQSTPTHGRAAQVYSMLADGTNQQKLTTQGDNTQPVWSNAIN